MTIANSSVDTLSTPRPERQTRSAPEFLAFPNASCISVLFVDHTARLSGGEIALSRLLTGIDRTKIRPIVLLGEDGPLVEKLHAIGVETHVYELERSIKDVRKDSLNLFAILRKLVGIAPFARYCRLVGEFAKQNKVDIIHTNSLKSDLYGGIAGRLNNIPVVWHIRDHINDSYLPRPAVIAFRYLSNIIPSFIVANSSSTLALVKVKRSDCTMVIPSGIDVSDDVHLNRSSLPTSSSNKNRSTREIRIGIVGRLAPWKGQHIFVKAAAKLHKLGYKAKYVIVGAALFGEDDYEQKLQKSVIDLGIENSIEFLGFCADVPSVLQDLDILVHASTTPEPFGQVVIEGMAAGLAVIGTDGGGVKEIISHQENGILIPMDDVDSMAEAIRLLIDKPERAKQLGTAAREHVRTNYSVANSARRMETVYRTLMERRK
jgi:glycosyltransferase involved in cell wall biosynthesis